MKWDEAVLNAYKSIAKERIAAKDKCMHDQCRECSGKGVRKDGSQCVHGVSCPCRKCNPQLLIQTI